MKVGDVVWHRTLGQGKIEAMVADNRYLHLRVGPNQHLVPSSSVGAEPFTDLDSYAEYYEAITESRT